MARRGLNCDKSIARVEEDLFTAKEYLHVKPQGGLPKERLVHMITGFGKYVPYIVHNANLINLERAVLERVFYVKGENGEFTRPPQPDIKNFNANMKIFLTKLKRNLPTSIPMTRHEFVESYKDRRRIVYEKAALSLEAEGLSAKDSIITAFIKFEKIDATNKASPVPRLIQPRDARYRVETGRYLRPIEKIIYKAIARVFGNTTIFKGLNASESGSKVYEKWTKFRKPVAISLDASRFDQHVSIPALEWEHSVYNYIYMNDPYLKWMLRMQLVNTGVGRVGDGVVRYRVNGCRGSGDMNTALGNCLLMSALVWSFMDTIGISNYECCNNGDDSVIITETENLPRIRNQLHEWFYSMGFNMKIEEPVYIIEKISFCQTQPVWTPSGYVMVRNPHTALIKDSISIIPLNAENAFRGYIGVLGLGGMSLTGGIPIWQAFYGCLSKHGTLKTNITLESGMMMMAKRMDRKWCEVHPSTRESFRLAFNIDSDVQQSKENEYSSRKLKHNVPKFRDGDISDPSFF